MISVRDFDPSLLKIDKTSYKSIAIYWIYHNEKVCLCKN